MEHDTQQEAEKTKILEIMITHVVGTNMEFK